jgi:hypothetical protein
MSSKCKLPEERVREALYSLGLPIVQGSVSTILGVVALLLAQSYIFLVFFKMVFLVILFGAMHGLFLLPVMLSLFGPNSCSNVDDSNFDDDAVMYQYKPEKKDGKMLHPFTITHPHLMTLASSPNGIYSSKQFMAANYKAYGNDEKDLGIGTSSEDSSENSSSKSQRRQAMEDENVKRRYEEGWRKSSQSMASPSPCTFQPNLDLYGNKFDDFWNSSDNLAKPVQYRSRNELLRERSDLELSKNDSLRKNEEPLYVRQKRLSDFESNGQQNDKKLHYYDYNQKRKFSDESYVKENSNERSRKYINTRRNIV